MIRLDQIAGKPSIGTKATLDDPLAHIFACHRRIEDRLGVLERAAAHLEDLRGEAIEAITNSFRFFDSNGVWHTADEEESIFPRIESRLGDADARFLHDLEAEHREAEALYSRLKELAANLTPSDSVSSDGVTAEFRQTVERLCAIYRSHIASEDSRFLDIARRVLDEGQLSEIAREMKARRGLV